MPQYYKSYTISPIVFRYYKKYKNNFNIVTKNIKYFKSFFFLWFCIKGCNDLLRKRKCSERILIFLFEEMHSSFCNYIEV